MFLVPPIMAACIFEILFPFRVKIFLSLFALEHDRIIPAEFPPFSA